MLIQEDVHLRDLDHLHPLVLHLDWLERTLLFREDQEVHQEDVHHQEDVQLKDLVHLLVLHLVLHLERTLLFGELYSKARFHKDVIQ